MDTETLSAYGWVVVLIIVLSFLIALATPIGKYAKDTAMNITNALCEKHQTEITKEINTKNEIHLKGNIPDDSLYFKGVTMVNDDITSLPVPEKDIVTNIGGKETVTKAKFPDIDKNRIDAFQYNDFLYIYNNDNNGWSVYATKYIEPVKNIDGTVTSYKMSNVYEQKTRFSQIVSSINNVPVTSLNGTFMNCEKLEQVPTIPSTVTNMNNTFNGCKALTGYVIINGTITTATNCFANTKQTIILTGNAPKETIELLKNSSGNLENIIIKK